jgi:hypothetical protein
MTPQQIEAVLADPAFLEYSYRTQMAAGKFPGSRAQFDALMEKQRPQQAREFATIGVPAVAQLLRTRQLIELSKDIAVLCMSEIETEILMWAHYAAGHSGLVVGFTTEHRPLSATDKLLQVVYESERAKLELAWTRDSPEYGRYVKELVTTKSPGWRYEREWRELFPLNRCKTEEQPSRRLYFVGIPSRLITRVILGWKCAEETEEAVRIALAQPYLQHVVLEKAVLHETAFALEVVKL